MNFRLVATSMGICLRVGNQSIKEKLKARCWYKNLRKILCKFVFSVPGKPFVQPNALGETCIHNNVELNMSGDIFYKKPCNVFF